MTVLTEQQKEHPACIKGQVALVYVTVIKS